MQLQWRCRGTTFCDGFSSWLRSIILARMINPNLTCVCFLHQQQSLRNDSRLVWHNVLLTCRSENLHIEGYSSDNRTGVENLIYTTAMSLLILGAVKGSTEKSGWGNWISLLCLIFFFFYLFSGGFFEFDKMGKADFNFSLLTRRRRWITLFDLFSNSVNSHQLCSHTYLFCQRIRIASIFLLCLITLRNSTFKYALDCCLLT